MPLSHICIWKDGKWKYTSANEAAEIFPNETVAASAEIFRCALCYQYVTFTNGTVQERHFRHSQSTEARACPEHSDTGNGMTTGQVFDPEKHSLPLRLVIRSSHSFVIEIGFIPVPIQLRGIGNEFVTIKNDNGKISKFCFENMFSEIITYRTIDINTISKEYILKVPETRIELRRYWPKKIEGMKYDGVFFTEHSHRMLLSNTEIQVGRKYYLLTKEILYGPSLRDISLYDKCHVEDWYVYSIIITKYTRSTSEFVGKFHYNLTDKPIVFYPIWPAHIETPYHFRHPSKRLFLFYQGDIEIQCLKLENHLLIQHGQNLCEVYHDGREMLVAAGRFNVNRYLYLQTDTQNPQNAPPRHKIYTKNGVSLEAGIHKDLPPKNLLRIEVPYDGFVQISKGNEIQKRFKIKSGELFTLQIIEMGQKIEVFQGLDCIWWAEFKEELPTRPPVNEIQFLRELNRCQGDKIKISPTIRSTIYCKLAEFPKIQQWFVDAVANGTFSNRAFLKIKSFLNRE